MTKLYDQRSDEVRIDEIELAGNKGEKGEKGLYALAYERRGA